MSEIRGVCELCDVVIFTWCVASFCLLGIWWIDGILCVDCIIDSKF